MFLFEIIHIKAGWFEVKLTVGEKSAVIVNSWYLGNDAPKVLLRNLNEMFDKQRDIRWLCWHDEPGAYLWELKKEQESLACRIDCAKKDSFRLPPEGRDLCGEEAVLNEITFTVPFYGFVQSVVKSFQAYEHGDARKVYQREWGDFPEKEFHACKTKLEQE